MACLKELPKIFITKHSVEITLQCAINKVARKLLHLASAAAHKECAVVALYTALHCSMLLTNNTTAPTIYRSIETRESERASLTYWHRDAAKPFIKPFVKLAF